MARRLPLLMPVILLLSLIAVQTEAAGVRDQADWTIAFFFNGDNNLEEDAYNDWNELEMAGSTDRVNLLLLIDGYAGQRAATKRCRVRHETTAAFDTSACTAMGELDMGDPQTAADFIIWTFQNYPARQYGIVFWDHGDGWSKRSGATLPAFKGFSSDDQSGNHISVAGGGYESILVQVTEWLSSHEGRDRIDLVGFDACLMGMWEVAHVTRPYADYFVASEETESTNGWDFTTFPVALTADPSIGPGELCAMIPDGSVASVEATLSCLDLDALGGLSDALDLQAAAMIADSASRNGVMTCARQATCFGGWACDDSRDLHEFNQCLLASASVGQTVRTAAGVTADALADTVLANAAIGEFVGVGGVAIYLPADGSFDTDYAASAGARWAADTRWDDFLSGGMSWEPDGYEPDNTLATATLLEVDAPAQDHNFVPSSDVDWYRIPTEAGSGYTLLSAVSDDTTDTVMELYNASGQKLAEDDDGGGGRASKIQFTSQAGGNYFARMRPFDSSSAGFYSMRALSGQAVIDDHPNSAAETGDDDRLIDKARVNGSIEYEGDVDFYWFRAHAGVRYTLQTGLGSLDDTVLTLLGMNGTSVIAENDDATQGVELWSKIVWTATADGVHFLKVRPYGSSETGGYSVLVDPACGGTPTPCLIAGVCAGTVPECAATGWSCLYPREYSPEPVCTAAADRNCNGTSDNLEEACQVADGDTPVDGDVPIDGDEPVDGDTPVDGDAPIDGDEPADGDTVPDGDGPVDGDTQVDGDLPIDGDGPVDGDTPVDGDVPIDGDGPVDGDTPVDGDVSIDGDGPVDGDTPVDGDVPIDGDGPVDGDTQVDGDVPIDGDGPVDGDTPVDGDVPIDGDEPVDGDAPVDGDDPVDGDSVVDGDMGIDGDTGSAVAGGGGCGSDPGRSGAVPLLLLIGLFGLVRRRGLDT